MMKRKIGITLLLIATLMLSLLSFTACGNDSDNNENAEKQVPVYQGMTITGANSTLNLSSASYSSGVIVLLGSDNKNTDDNGNHYGHYKGDHTDRDDTIDEENPYPDNEASENIEEEIKSSIDVIGSPDAIYYAEPGQDIYINIHISNPDSFEIMSFTLNGKKYSSYMFEDGSDMETIVLKYNVGNAAGIVEYTIDAIKYVDGTEIKDVIIDGNKTVMAGIKTENQVAANVTDVDIDTNALSFNVNIKDSNALIEFSKGALKAVLYDGFNIISEKDVAVGDNVVTFDGLKTYTIYQYAIVGYYDNLSGGGFGMNVLYKDAFYTDSVVLFDNIEVGQESISFGYIWHEDHQGKAISALKLYNGDAFIRDIDAASSSVNELLSNTTYKLVAEYPNADKTESIYLEFTTLAKAVPEISVHTPTSTQTSVGFTVTEADEDNVGAVTKIELVHASGTTLADSLTQREFVGLLSNNEYTVKVTYDYNLNDGTGDKTVVKELAVTTLAKATPDFTITNTAKGQESLSFGIGVTDTDNVGAITKVELIHGTEITTLENVTKQEIKGLLSNNEYTVKVTYVYNLNDGVGERTIIEEVKITTDAKSAPSFAVKNENITVESIYAEYDISDVDNILSYYRVEIYEGDTLVLENTNKEIDFTGLNYYTDYNLKITYTYNLNDGKGEQTSIFEKNYKTLPFVDVLECSVINTNAVSDGDTIFMSVKIDNPYGIEIESVIINGKVYSVTGNSVQNQIFVEIVCDGQFNGGDTNLKIEHLNAKIDNKTISIAPQNEVSDNIFINGTLEVIGIEYVNENFEPIHYSIGSDRIFVLLTVDNPTGYNIDDMKEVGLYTDFTKNFIKIDNDHWYYEYFWDWEGGKDGKYEINVESISYSNQHISKTVTSHIKTNEVMLISNPDPVYISEPDDLKNMSYGRYYVLTNDIDLAGLEWQGADFYGIFDGNGYSIKNMSFVGNIKEQSANLGLFNNADGIIENLNLSSVLIMVEAASDANGHCELSCGAIAARASKCVIQNCTVDSNSIINVKNTTSGNSYVGGIVGYINDNAQISQCTNNGSVNSVSTSYCTYTGGLAGYAHGIIITKSHNSGDVDASGSSVCAGGLVGDAYNSIIHDSKNSGTVSASGDRASAGGLIALLWTDGSREAEIYSSMNSGYISATGTSTCAGGLMAYAYSVTISDCANVGSINAGSTGGLLAFVYYDQAITNSYSSVTSDGINGEACTVEQLNSREFYTETLGWSESVWEFSNLDVENGKLPELKQ